MNAIQKTLILNGIYCLSWLPGIVVLAILAGLIMLDTIIVDGPHPLASKNPQIVLKNSLNNSGEIEREKKKNDKKLSETWNSSLSNQFKSS